MPPPVSSILVLPAPPLGVAYPQQPNYSHLCRLQLPVCSCILLTTTMLHTLSPYKLPHRSSSNFHLSNHFGDLHCLSDPLFYLIYHLLKMGIASTFSFKPHPQVLKFFYLLHYCVITFFPSPHLLLHYCVITFPPPPTSSYIIVSSLFTPPPPPLTLLCHHFSPTPHLLLHYCHHFPPTPHLLLHYCVITFPHPPPPLTLLCHHFPPPPTSSYIIVSSLSPTPHLLLHYCHHFSPPPTSLHELEPPPSLSAAQMLTLSHSSCNCWC